MNVSRIARYRQLVATRRGLALVGTHSLVAFGLISAVVQLVTAVQRFPDGLIHPIPVLVSIALASVSWGFIQARPRTHIYRELHYPEMRVSVLVGDLFDSPGHLAVGFCDTFDTDSENDIVIHSRSVQAQLLERVYGGDRSRLDSEIDAALENSIISRVEDEHDKARGKRVRYEIGTIAVLGPPRRRIFGVAYTEMGNDLKARSNSAYLWRSMHELWKSVGKDGLQGCISIPLIGTEFARASSLEREAVLRMIVLSFVVSCREDPICKELRVVVNPADAHKINMLEVGAFLKSI